MSAMPEREVFATELNEQEWLVSYLREAMKMAEKLVPESRLLAAEARVREVEAERDAWIERAVTAVGHRDERIATLRAERDALVPLLRYFVEYVEDGTYDDEDGGQAPTHDCDFIGNPEAGHCEFHDKWGEARAILAREAE